VEWAKLIANALKRGLFFLKKIVLYDEIPYVSWFIHVVTRLLPSNELYILSFVV
jgi:hypothetical protein